jgi:hypothetical protein
MLSTGIIVLIVAVLAIWVLIELKRIKHKVFAIFLIGLIIFTYFTFITIVKKNDLDLKTISGLTQATKIYATWLSSAFVNVKTITTNAIKMDWTSPAITNQSNSTLNSS